MNNILDMKKYLLATILAVLALSFPLRAQVYQASSFGIKSDGITNIWRRSVSLKWTT